LKLIITADDLGASDEVNEAIIECLEAGVISRASVLANGKALDGVRPHLKKGHTLGLHFNLSEGHAMIPGSVSGIVQNGNLVYQKSKLQLWNRDKKEALRSELLAQVKALRDIGTNVSYVDSHHHVHTDIGVAALFADTCIAENIFQSRPARTDLATTPVHMLWKRRANKIFIAKGLKMAEQLVDIERFDGEKLREKKFSSIELMLHPVIRDGRVEDRSKPGIALIPWLQEHTQEFELIRIL